MIINSRRTPVDLALDAGTAMILATLAWGGAWTMLDRGWRAGAGLFALVLGAAVVDRLLRVAAGARSNGLRLVSALLLVAMAAIAALDGATLLAGVLP